MEEEACLAVEQALKFGAQYAEARVQRDVAHTFTLNNGRAEPITTSRKRGIGVRVLVDGSMGFASTNSLESSQIRSSSETAVKTAKAAARLVSTPIKLAPEQSFEDEWEAQMKIDFQEVSIEEKFEVLHSVERAITPELVGVSLPSRILLLDEELTEKFYANSEGSRIRGSIPRISLYFILTAEEKGNAKQETNKTTKEEGEQHLFRI